MRDDISIDWARETRTGAAEAVFCSSKSVAQIEALLRDAADRRLLLTRLSVEQVAGLPDGLAERLDYDPVSRTGILGPARRVGRPRICLVAGGSSDLPVVAEAERTLAFHGQGATRVLDVGVAGLWRLLDRLDIVRGHDVVHVFAGMEGALFSVVAGLIDAPVVAVPVSVGYGVADAGRAALSSALASCAPGVGTVNIDNGFGAACLAIKILGIRRGDEVDYETCARPRPYH